jgi:hypothetical protein
VVDMIGTVVCCVTTCLRRCSFFSSFSTLFASASLRQSALPSQKNNGEVVQEGTVVCCVTTCLRRCSFFSFLDALDLARISLCAGWFNWKFSYYMNDMEVKQY